MFFFFFQAEDGIRDLTVTGVQTCALPILLAFFVLSPASMPPPDKGLRLGKDLPMQVLADAGRSMTIEQVAALPDEDRKSTRLNSSHSQISYAVFCLKKKKKQMSHPVFNH